MKVGKEEMIGLLVAIENYLAEDETDERARCESIVEQWVKQFSAIAGVSAQREFPGTDGRSLPRAVIRLGRETTMDGAGLAARLRANDPAIAVAVACEHAIYLNPELLRPGEEEVVAAALASLLRPAAVDALGAVG